MQLVDVNPSRAAVAAALGVEFVEPAAAQGDCDLVIHASATAAGLSRSIELLGDEGEVIELSWYGTDQVPLTLGADFHARRLAIGAVRSVRCRRSPGPALARRPDAIALELLGDDALDAVISGSSPFAELPATMARVAAGQLDALCHVIDYEEEPSSP